MLSNIFHWVDNVLGIGPMTQGKIIHSMLAVAVLYIITMVISLFIKKKAESLRTVYMWNKTLGYLRMFILIFVIIRIWFEGAGELSTYLGLLSAGVAIALKDPISNFAGWIFIIWRRPFELGDRIEISNHKGDVIDIRIFQFTLMEIGNWVNADQSTGRIIHIPNGNLFVNSLANYNKGFELIWNEIGVLITFESNWKSAKKIMEALALELNPEMEKKAEQKIKESAKKFMIYYKNLSPIVYTSVKDSGILLTLRYLCEPRQRRGSENDIWEKILDEFSKHNDIDLAYPTTRFYDNKEEGKRVEK